MDRTDFHLSRREVMMAAAAAAAAAAVPLRPARAAAKYRRYNAASDKGKEMLAIYAKGVEAMLETPPDHPHNWFRNAFVHMMDCPHGNWWFYVWHRGYIGYFEETIRAVTKEDSFTLPYWDWTEHPEIQLEMFEHALTPTAAAFERYTGNLARFTEFIQPALSKYWDGLTADQRTQMNLRGYTEFKGLWNDVVGLTKIDCVPDLVGVAGNQAFTITGGARYLSRDNRKLDEETAKNVDIEMIRGGLSPQEFNVTDPHTGFTDPARSFTSSKTTSHQIPPPGRQVFSTLEAFPHNKVHNYIGGVGLIDPGPYGVMANNLSPIDPIFFLHHANMDRLWDVWTRKQLHCGWAPGPAASDSFYDEPFLFYVKGDGSYVGAATAREYFDTAKFDYDYEPGSGEEVVSRPCVVLTAEAGTPMLGSVAANAATFAVPQAAVRSHIAESGGQTLVAAITLTRPNEATGSREFAVLVNAPEGVTRVSADSPNFAGTFALFGAPMPGMHAHGGMDVTFAVPLPKTLPAFTALGAANEATLNIRVVPSDGQDQEAPVLKAVSLATR